ncbi:MAG: caspase family protein, partial [Bradyrhizobium sp.]
LNDDNECEKRREKKPVASRDRPETPRNRPEAKQFIAGRSQAPMSKQKPGSRPLTGDEREQGCNSWQAIMSGVCP